MRSHVARSYNLREVVTGDLSPPGLVYRSSCLVGLSGATHRLLVDGLGIRSVIDLRTANERRRAPCELQAGGLSCLQLPLTPGSWDSPSDWMADADDLGWMYLSMLDTNGAPLVEALHRLAEDLPLPTLICCSAGKDRTGVLAACVQALIGVSEEEIVADYSRSDMAMLDVLPRIAATHDAPARLSRLPPVLLNSPPNAMWTLLRLLRDERGGLVPALAAAGLRPGMVDRLRMRLAASTRPGHDSPHRGTR